MPDLPARLSIWKYGWRGHCERGTAKPVADIRSGQLSGTEYMASPVPGAGLIGRIGCMKAETEALALEIKQCIELLRRHL